LAEAVDSEGNPDGFANRERFPSRGHRLRAEGASMIGRARHLLQRIAVAIAACGSIHGVAYADLSWFGRDDPTRPSEPIRMSEIVAWSDACLDIDGGTWDAVIRIHRDYLDSWRIPTRRMSLPTRFVRWIARLASPRNGWQPSSASA
jgi:hypothetical protein